MGFRVALSLALAALVVRMPTLAAQDSNLAPNAPPDRPLHVAGQAATAHLDSLVQPYIAQARATYPAARARFLAGLPPHHMFSITTALEDARGHREVVFVAVDSLVRDSVYGRIRSPIYLVRGYRLGQRYAFAEAALIDWTISRPDGSEEGNVVGKFIDSLQQ